MLFTNPREITMFAFGLQSLEHVARINCFPHLKLDFQSMDLDYS